MPAYEVTYKDAQYGDTYNRVFEASNITQAVTAGRRNTDGYRLVAVNELENTLVGEPGGEK